MIKIDLNTDLSLGVLDFLVIKGGFIYALVNKQPINFTNMSYLFLILLSRWIILIYFIIIYHNRVY